MIRTGCAGNAQIKRTRRVPVPLRVGRRCAVCSSYLDKCVSRESRPRLRGHDRGQHLALAQIKKAVINSETLTAEKKNAMAILSYVLKNVLDLLHPVMPFITEELNSILFQGSEMVISRAWPKADESLIDAKIEAAFDQAFAVVESVRGVRGRYNVSPATKLNAVVSVDDAATEASVKDCMAIITELSGLSDLSVAVKAVKPKFSASAVVPGGELYIPLEGLLDPAAEIARLEKDKCVGRESRPNLLGHGRG